MPDELLVLPPAPLDDEPVMSPGFGEDSSLQAPTTTSTTNGIRNFMLLILVANSSFFHLHCQTPNRLVPNAAHTTVIRHAKILNVATRFAYSAAMASTADLLKDIHLFSMLDETERSLLAARVEVIPLKAGETLFRYGDPGDAMYILKSGTVELSVTNKTGERSVFENPQEGDFFGEISLLDEGPRTASADVIEAGEALRVDREDLKELFRIKPDAAFDILAALGKRLRQTNAILRNTATRNVNEVAPDGRSTVMKVADWIAEFSGSLPFLFMHLGLFTLWILLNVGEKPIGGFDPFPFGFLTLVVSLEAIILSVFVLLSQNRQVERERVRSDVEYDINLKAELQIQQLHEKFDAQSSQVLARLERIEKKNVTT
jgi:CRP/FNR family transcriptional regulator, cyclic AMP receptor protein